MCIWEMPESDFLIAMNFVLSVFILCFLSLMSHFLFLSLHVNEVESFSPGRNGSFNPSGNINLVCIHADFSAFTS